MKKKIIAASLLLLLLAGCGSDNDESKESTSATLSPSENAVTTTSPEAESPSESGTDGTTETTTKFPQIPGEVLYSDNNNVGVKAPHGGLFFNGEPVESENFDILVGNSMITVTPDFATSPEADKHLPEGVKPQIPVTTKTETATTTEAPETTLKDEEKYDLGEYVKTGNTDFAVTDVKIFSSSDPGVEGVKYFEPGETFFINLWCNTIKFLDAEIYLVPHDTKHKDSYTEKEYVSAADMMLSNVYADGKLFCELQIPRNIDAGIYDIRILCGGEEGYVTYYIG